MTKEEIALQLTLSRKDLLAFVESKGDSKDSKENFNKSIAIETVKMYNTILKSLEINLEN